MPQMAPISWLILFFIFIISFLMFNFLNFFSFINKKILKEEKNQPLFTKNMMNWKW